MKLSNVEGFAMQVRANPKNNIAEIHDETEADTLRGVNLGYHVSMFPYEARDILYMVREMTPRQRRDSFEYLVEASDYINKAIKECQ